MSFILDALKKSETERQQQGSAEFAAVPTSAAAPRSSLWLWLLGLLLAVNLAVLLGILLRPGVQPVQEPAAVEPLTLQAPAPAPLQAAPAQADPVAAAPIEEPVEESFAAQIDAARTQLAAANPEPAPAPAAQVAAAVPAAAEAAPPTLSTARIPTIDELRLAGNLDLAELRIDIHVHSADPAERFVFINMSKHREGSQLAEGPTVREITPDGVVLEYRGRIFLLPRE